MTNRQLLQHKTEDLTESEISEVLDYINSLESLREQSVRPDLFSDEIVSLLSDSVENRRARVVIEWEKIRRRAENRAANFAAAAK
jgi:UDP-N-acetylglucosamine pyrophosphorylase